MHIVVETYKAHKKYILINEQMQDKNFARHSLRTV